MENIVEHKLNIPANYQYRALMDGNFFQRQWHRNRLVLIKELNLLHALDTVADVGCGSGNVVLNFANQVKSITGFDYNGDSVKFLNNMIASNGIGNAGTAELDITQKIPNKYSNSFSKIVLNEVIEHFEEFKIDGVLVNLHNMLKTGGQVLITTPNYGAGPWEIMEIIMDKLKLAPFLRGEQHLIKFSIKKLEQHCRSAGFQIIRSGTFSLFSPVIALFGQNLADHFARIEIRHLNLLGPQIFLIVQKME